MKKLMWMVVISVVILTMTIPVAMACDPEYRGVFGLFDFKETCECENRGGFLYRGVCARIDGYGFYGPYAAEKNGKVIPLEGELQPAKPNKPNGFLNDDVGAALMGAGITVLSGGFTLGMLSGNFAPVVLGGLVGAAFWGAGGAFVLFEEGPLDKEGYDALFRGNPVAKVGAEWIVRVDDPPSLLIFCEQDSSLVLPGTIRLNRGEFRQSGANVQILGPLRGQICRGGGWEPFTS
jgi:hypothetical protein